MIYTIAAFAVVLPLIAGSTAQPAAEPAPGQARAAEERAEPYKVGERLPDFTLQNEKGVEVSLASQLAKGPVVMTFYRGTWCPYCVKSLDTLEESVGDINALGGTVLAISPQEPEHAVDLREKTGLTYELLVDKDNALAARLGLVFTLDEKTVEKYRGYGIDVPASNGTDTWQLPIPATYVVDRKGVIRYAWTDKDYTKRAPVQQIVSTLRAIRSEG